MTTTGLSVSKQGLLEIPRIKLKKAGQTNAKKEIPILCYVNANISGLSKLSLKLYDALKTNSTPPKDTIIELLWHLAYFFKKKLTKMVGLYV